MEHNSVDDDDGFGTLSNDVQSSKVTSTMPANKTARKQMPRKLNTGRIFDCAL